VIVVMSSSSPVASIAVYGRNGELKAVRRGESRRQASALICGWYDELVGAAIPDLFVADVGPGSFTGVRVAVVMAQSYAFVHHRNCAAISSFDLIANEGTRFVPAHGDFYWVRDGDGTPEKREGLPETGLGYGGGQTGYPDAGNAALLLGALVEISPEKLLPVYLAEPHITISKRPLSGVGEG